MEEMNVASYKNEGEEIILEFHSSPGGHNYTHAIKKKPVKFSYHIYFKLDIMIIKRDASFSNRKQDFIALELETKGHLMSFMMQRQGFKLQRI